MGRYLQQNQGRSELQQRIAADLRAKAAERAKQEYGTDGERPAPSSPDGIEDSSYLRGTKQTTSLAWAWLVVAVMVIVIFVMFVVQMSS